MSARFKVRPCGRGWQRASTAWSRLAASGRGASEREVLGFGNASRFGAPTAAMLSPTAPASGTTWVQHPGGREELRAGWCCRCCTFSGDRQPAKGKFAVTVARCSYLTSVTNRRRPLGRQCVRIVVCDYSITALDLRDSLSSRHAPQGL